MHHRGSILLALVSGRPILASAHWAGGILRQNWWQTGGNSNVRQEWGVWRVRPLLPTAERCFSHRQACCPGPQPATPTPHGVFHGAIYEDTLYLPSATRFSSTDFFPLLTHTAPEGPDPGANDSQSLAVIRWLLTTSVQLFLIPKLKFHLVLFFRSTSSSSTFCSILCFSLRPACFQRSRRQLRPHLHWTSSFWLRVRLRRFLPLWIRHNPYNQAALHWGVGPSLWTTRPMPRQPCSHFISFLHAPYFQTWSDISSLQKWKEPL